MTYTVVLVKPSRPQNLGAIYRILENFNCSQLVIVDNQVDLTHLEFQKTARHVRYSFFEKVVFVNSLPEALSLVTFSVGTTARFTTNKNPKRISFIPEEIPWDVVGNNPGFVFGPERTGLKNHEIQLCDFLVAIPSSPAYPSLNLSHAVGILAYVAYRFYFTEKNSNREVFQSPATFELKKQLMTTFQGYNKRFFGIEKQRINRETFHNLWGRTNLSINECHTLIGIFNAWKWHITDLEKRLEKI